MKNFYKNIFGEISNLLNQSDINSLDKIAKTLIKTKKKIIKLLYLEMGVVLQYQVMFL